MPHPAGNDQENQSLRNAGTAAANRRGSNRRTGSQATISPSLGLNPAANKSMESLQILQWCQERDLPRPATNEGLEVYKQASRYLPNKEAQLEIPKWTAMVTRMRELQRQFTPLQVKKGLAAADAERRKEIIGEWRRLQPEYEVLVERIRQKQDQFELCKTLRRKSMELKVALDDAELARLEVQTGEMNPNRGPDFPPTPQAEGHPRLVTPLTSPLSDTVKAEPGVTPPKDARA